MADESRLPCARPIRFSLRCIRSARRAAASEVEGKNLKMVDFVKESGDAAVVWITPSLIERHFGTKWSLGKARLRRVPRALPRPVFNWLRGRIKRAEPFSIPARFFDGLPRIAETSRYRLIEDLIAHRDDLRGSLWFRRLSEERAARGYADYKGRKLRSDEDILDFLATYQLGLIESMRKSGFDASKTGFEATAVIDGAGRLMKTGSGNHRFCIAALLDLPVFPLMIVGAHEDWVRRTISGPVTTDKVLAELPAIARAHRRPGCDVSDLARQDDAKCGAVSRCALDLQASAVTVDDVLDDREAKAGAAHLT